MTVNCPICRDLQPVNCPGCGPVIISNEDLAYEMYRDVGEERPVTNVNICGSPANNNHRDADRFGYYPGCNEG